MGSLGSLLKVFIILLLIFMIAGELSHLYSPNRAPMVYMLTGHYSWMFWSLQIFLGAIVPLVILFHPRTKNSVRGVVLASILVVIGIFIKRLYLVIPGLAYPQHYYPGEIQGMWGALGTFPPSAVEIILSIGIFGFLALIFVLGLKFMDLLPASTKDEVATEAVAAEE